MCSHNNNEIIESVCRHKWYSLAQRVINVYCLLGPILSTTVSRSGGVCVLFIYSVHRVLTFLPYRTFVCKCIPVPNEIHTTRNVSIVLMTSINHPMEVALARVGSLWLCHCVHRFFGCQNIIVLALSSVEHVFILYIICLFIHSVRFNLYEHESHGFLDV